MPDSITNDNLVLFWGFTKEEMSYRDLVKSGPFNLNIHTLSFQELTPSARLSFLERNTLQFLEKQHIQKTFLMGTSLGGALAIIFASLHPDRVKHLFLVDCEGIYDHQNIIRAAWNFFLSHNSGREQKFNRNLKATLRTFSKPIQHLKLAWLAHHIDVQDQAKSLTVPTTIIWGQHDHITPLWQGEKLHQLIPNSKLTILPNLDHDWIMYYPNKFWEIFLNSAKIKR